MMRMMVFRLEETREEIVKYLRPNDIKNLSLASPEWREFLDKPKYWRRFKIFLTNTNYRQVLTSERLVARNKVAVWYKTKHGDGEDDGDGDDEQVLLEKVRGMIGQQETKLSKLAILIDPCTTECWLKVEEIRSLLSLEDVSISWKPWCQTFLVKEGGKYVISKPLDYNQAKIVKIMWRRHFHYFIGQLMREIRSSSGCLKVLSLDSWNSSERPLCDPELFADAITKLRVFKCFGENIERDHLKALFERITKDPDQINLRRVYLGFSPPEWIKIKKDLHGEYCEARKHVKFLVKK